MNSASTGPADCGDGYFSDGGDKGEADVAASEGEELGDKVGELLEEEDDGYDELEGDELIESLRRGIENELTILEDCH